MISLSPRAAIPLALATCGLLCGCSYPFGNDITSIYKITQNAFTTTDDSVSLTEAASSPYASMGIRIGNSPEIMLLLASKDSEQELWTSASRIALTTRHGRIVSTSGLEHNMANGTFRSMNDGRDLAGTTTWQVDFPEDGLYGVTVACVARSAGPETITILGAHIQTTRIDEECSSQSKALEWRFQNTYWTDPANGMIWRSRQYIHPQLAPVELEILRPPG